ncbi:MAG: hypothetical protein M1816_000073 [Peltula sp. TS41687]|nr:MAG: hypothetical protein M1816_000073 [Peltula sp. TS41687]
MWNFGDADHDGRNDSNQVFDAVDRLIEKCAPEKVPQYRAAVEKIKEKNLEDNMRFTEEDMLSALDRSFISLLRFTHPPTVAER